MMGEQETTVSVTCPHCGDVSQHAPDHVLSRFTCGACDKAFSPHQTTDLLASLIGEDEAAKARADRSAEETAPEWPAVISPATAPNEVERMARGAAGCQCGAPPGAICKRPDCLMLPGATMAVPVKLLREAHAVMRQCGWQLAPAVEDGGDGVLALAAAQVEEAFGDLLKAPGAQRPEWLRDQEAAAFREMGPYLDRLQALGRRLGWPLGSPLVRLAVEQLEGDHREAGRTLN
jgi:ribosomal protein S27AE